MHDSMATIQIGLQRLNPSLVGLIESILQPIAGVESTKVDIPQNTITVLFNRRLASCADFIRLLRDAGLIVRTISQESIPAPRSAQRVLNAAAVAAPSPR